MRPVEHRPPRPGNPGASRSVLRRRGAGASAATALRAPGGRGTSAGSGWRPRAAPHPGTGASTCDRSSGCRGRSGCKGPPAGDSVRTGTGAPQGPHAPRPGPRTCWTDASQRATLLWHRLQRHGVGRGTVVKLPGEEDRCRVHLLRHERSCIPNACVQRRPALGCGVYPISHPAPPAWPPSRAARLANILIDQPNSDRSTEPAPRSQTTRSPPHQRIGAGPDRRSQAANPIASAPQKVTRHAPARTLAPPARAETKPSMARKASDVAATDGSGFERAPAPSRPAIKEPPLPALIGGWRAVGEGRQHGRQVAATERRVDPHRSDPRRTLRSRCSCS